MDEATIQAYEQLAEDYDRETAGFWDEFPADFIADFAGKLPRPARVLNAGSGPGRDGSLLSAAGLNLICLDASRKMVEMSKARGLLSVQGDLLHLPFSPGEFDAVWSYTTLLHLRKRDLDRALCELGRVLRPERPLALGMIEGEGEYYRRSSGVSLPRWFAFYTPEELSHHLSRAGFSVEAIRKLQPAGGKYVYLNILARKI